MSHQVLRGKIVGTSLMIEAARWPKSLYPRCPLYLEVLECNPVALRFYRSLGGRDIGVAYWNTPCGNRVKEYFVGWDNDSQLLCDN